MPWLLRKQFPFEASHQLPRHDGPCARLHGHSWCLRVEVQGDVLQTEGPQTGMVVDYGQLTAAVRPLLTQALDHYHLNTSTGLAHPTSEALAQWIYEHLVPSLPGLVAVEIAETATTVCRYTRPARSV